MVISNAERVGDTEADLDAFLRELEGGLNPRYPERSTPPVQVIAYGEMSAVLSVINVPVASPWVFKRLPIFRTMEEAEAYEQLCGDYLGIIQHEIGIQTPRTRFKIVESRPGLVTFYAIQERLPAESLGNNVIRTVSDSDAAEFLKGVLSEAERVWDFNRGNSSGVELALDMQLSNWAAPLDDAGRPITTARPVYIDLTTPLMRRGGREQLNPAQLLRSCPPLLRGLVEHFLAEGVINRYYDYRQVLIDVLANCIKEEREDLLPAFIEIVNAFLTRVANGSPNTCVRSKDVYGYYRGDAGIWMLFLGLKKLDRFIKTRLLGQPYDFVLPEQIARNFPFRNHPKMQRGERHA